MFYDQCVRCIKPASECAEYTMRRCVKGVYMNFIIVFMDFPPYSYGYTSWLLEEESGLEIRKLQGLLEGDHCQIY